MLSIARLRRITWRASQGIGMVLVGALCGCAHSSDEIQAQYVSPIQYAGHNCQQITAEQQRVSARVGELAGKVDDNAAGDAVATGIGLILFWPALFFVDGDGPEAEEYARLKGEYEALRKAGIEKNCATAASTGGDGVASSTSVPMAAEGGAPGGRSILVTPTVKAKIERYMRNCEAQSTSYCVIAVRNDGTKVGLGKGDNLYAARIEQAKRSAITNCGGPSECVVVYEGGTTRINAIVP